MALAIAAVVGFGFGQTLDVRVIHASSPRPLILYVHIAVFTAWVLIFITQTVLVRIGRVAWHMSLGTLAVALGTAMPFVGIATALAMTRLGASSAGAAIEGEAFLALSFFDMLAFAVIFWIAVSQRRRPDYHRRLMLMASCGLTVAAFARFPSVLMPGDGWYVGVDLLILIGVARDLVIERRVHPVYAVGLPVLMAGQAAVMWLYWNRPSAWLAIARLILQLKWVGGLSLLAAVGSPALAAGAPSSDPARQAWVASWATSPEAPDSDDDDSMLKIDGQTVRQRVRLSVGGEQLRLQLSNEYGSTSLVIGSATVALPADAGGVQPKSLRALTFGGRGSVTIPPGAPVTSDPVDFAVASNAEVTVSLYFPQRVRTPTVHSLALKHAIITPRGDFTRADHVETQAVSVASIALNAILVPARPGQRLVVAFGDSITDGDFSSVDADRGWPSDLSRRLSKQDGAAGLAIVNEGIAGNRLLADGFGISSLGRSALARFDRDALAIPGVTHVVLEEGLNDLGFPGATLGGQPLGGPGELRTAQDLIDAYGQLIARAHVRGVRVIGVTLAPFEGVDLPGYYSASKEAMRQAINQWIRTSGAFDAVIDFDVVLRDPGHPSRLLSRYASSDHLHPNDRGYQAVADAIDATLFK